ncbi:MAG: 16S rRNA (cytosine(1402)-N(4))-methyltransferase RsmH [Bacteroidota bacterium]
MTYHETVLLRESIEGLAIKPGGVYVDATFGGGGHSAEILKGIGNGRLFAFDQDSDAMGNALDDKRLTLVHANFRYLKNFLKYHKIHSVDGIIADLGISSHQIDHPERGFTFRSNAEIDLRMNTGSNRNAQKILAEYNTEDLSRLFFEYGDLKEAKKIAGAIVQFREGKRIKTMIDLKEAIGRFAEKGKENKFFAKTLQALRIEINLELESLKELLLYGTEMLVKGGRWVIISYHSLEDRLVKNFLKAGNFEGIEVKDFFGNKNKLFNVITSKPVVPGEIEIERNNRARSAKMRIAEKN